MTFLEGYVRGALNVVCSTSVNWSCSKSEQIGNLKISSMDLEILDFIASHLIAISNDWLAILLFRDHFLMSSNNENFIVFVALSHRFSALLLSISYFIHLTGFS